MSSLKIEYPTPDELDRMLDELNLSPQTEAWIVGAIMDYRIAARTVMGMMVKEKECVTD